MKQHNLIVYFCIVAGVFLLLRALYLPGPLGYLSTPPNTKILGSYRSQVDHWDRQIAQMEWNNPGDLAKYRQDPALADPIFRHLYEDSFLGYNLATIFMATCTGMGVGLIGASVFMQRRWRARQLGNQPPPAFRDVLLIATAAVAFLVLAISFGRGKIESDLTPRASLPKQVERSPQEPPVAQAAEPSTPIGIAVECDNLSATVQNAKVTAIIDDLSDRLHNKETLEVLDQARFTLKCSVRLANESARVTAMLADSRGGRELMVWSKTYDRPLSAQDSIINDIVKNTGNAVEKANQGHAVQN